MDDFEFLLPEDEPTVEIHDHDDPGHAPPFHHLASLPTHQLPKTIVPTRGVTTTIGGSIRELVMSRNTWGPKLNLSQLKPQETPLLGSAGQPVDQPPTLGSREESQASAQAPQEKYVWMPTRRPPAVWSESDTQLFFDGIAQFGTDLSSIAVLFPGRTRQDIAHKFRVENTKRPNHMQSALLVQNQRPIDVEKFKEAKKKCDELKAEPVRVLDAEEQEALDQLLGTLEQPPAPPRAAGTAKDDPEGPQFPAVVPSFTLNTPQGDFSFDDEDAPITSLYSSKGRYEQRLDTADSAEKKPVKRARSPVATARLKPKKVAVASPLPRRDAIKLEPATQAALPPVPPPKLTEDFEFEDDADHMMTFEEAAGITASQEDDNDLVFDHDYRSAAAADTDREEEFGFL
jgi:hypothetical protein